MKCPFIVQSYEELGKHSGGKRALMRGFELKTKSKVLYVRPAIVLTTPLCQILARNRCELV